MMQDSTVILIILAPFATVALLAALKILLRN
jgi:hypothetical protein